MRSIKEIVEIRKILAEQRKNDKKIAFVPTMGALHAGHLSLVKIAKEKSDFVVVSIFVNPLQFNSATDLAAYPRVIEKDLELLSNVGVDAVFVPAAEAIYANGDMLAASKQISTRLTAGQASRSLCGATRPGHFDGVVTVVTILFNIIQPDIAVFGSKDFQQVKVIEQMVNDLSIPVEIISAPIVREEDGLALSSRNLLLSKDGRIKATLIYKALAMAKDRVIASHKVCVGDLVDLVRTEISKEPALKIDYIDVADGDSLRLLSQHEICDDKSQLLIAAYCDNVRLIDNISL